MFAKFFQKIHNQHQSPQHDASQGSLEQADLDPRVTLHYGIPSTASILAFDPIQGLLAIGTLDGRIKVIGGDNIEALLISPKQLPFKNLEFLQNQGFLASISTENEIQVTDVGRFGIWNTGE
jgi:syntaxin-binding protein 5